MIVLSGDIEIRVIVTEDNAEGTKHYYKLKGSDTTSMSALKNIMPTLSEPDMKDPQAVVQTSIGNQGDLEGISL